MRPTRAIRKNFLSCEIQKDHRITGLGREFDCLESVSRKVRLEPRARSMILSS
jgi:hypothetical protein